MRFQILSLLALVGSTTVTANRWVGMENLPDGPYKGVTHADGSTTVTSLDTGENYTFALTQDSDEEQKRAIEKRYISCWGYQLDHGGVDDAVVQLKDWASTGHELDSGATTNYFGYNVNGVYVYYCINAPNSSGNLDVVDVDYALGQMDSQCQLYEAGYYQWDGSPEIVGKCRSGTAVCLG
ncbi:hypothetical protein ACHAQJ_008194 [Trichoderma viride]